MPLQFTSFNNLHFVEAINILIPDNSSLALICALKSEEKTL
jgi:hypothetical protein